MRRRPPPREFGRNPNAVLRYSAGANGNDPDGATSEPPIQGRAINGEIMSLQLLERNFKFEIPPIELKEAPLALPPVQVPLREVSPRVQRRLSKRARPFAAVEFLEGMAGLAKPTVENLPRLFH